MRHLIFVLFCLGTVFSTEAESARASLIPRPQQVKWGTDSFDISNTAIVIDSKTDTAQAAHAAELLKTILIENKVKAFVSKGCPASLVSGSMTLTIDPSISSDPDYEGYRLNISPRNLKLSAPNATGLFYGVQTIRQLIQHENGKISIPCCQIKDWPEFKIRGFMHDVGRNYQPPSLLKEQIEVMARYKYNVFHMHITDNPGWRLESKKYPKVNDPASMTRKPGMIYSQEEFKDLVHFCRERHMILIPELDIPGHTEAFRKALNVKSMGEPRVQKILIDLFEELCDLAPAQDMPYIHLGTDEAHKRAERVNRNTFLPPIYKAIRAKDRRIIGWMRGMTVEGDTETINQLWARAQPRQGHAYIDSRQNYMNHLDPFAGIVKLYYQKPGWGITEDGILGGILCSWQDNRVDQERGVLKLSPIYSSMVTYSESVWTGKKENYEQYWSRLPEPAAVEFQDFVEFEKRLVDHRDRFFNGKEFFYVRQTHIPWRLIHFPSIVKMTKQPVVETEIASYPVEQEIKESYATGSGEVTWLSEEFRGATVHLKHFFKKIPSFFKEKSGTVYALTYIHSPKDQAVGFWISFHDWSSAGRRGGPLPQLGQWHTNNAKIWVNDHEVAPPQWKNPGLPAKSPEVPFEDENCYYREPTQVNLQKGWNKILLKIPAKNTWKWMFTCVPVQLDGQNVREVEGLTFSTSPGKKQK